ncbi:hypothetical protein BJY04DRAFT_182938 [Aspergillus karnatakaensis]|uniref:uncharacterized protein n=1 Tax=Aspergillus karnatakaensis TaxID=1810916 RepID=UPI003CCE3F8B
MPVCSLLLTKLKLLEMIAVWHLVGICWQCRNGFSAWQEHHHHFAVSSLLSPSLSPLIRALRLYRKQIKLTP